jgi:HEAT repeat protein
MVTKFGNKLIPLLSINILLDQLIIPEYHIKQDIVKILNQKMTDSSKTSLEKQQIDLLLPLLDDPDFDIQATTMEILGRIPNALPNRIIMERLNHPNPRIKTAATLALGSLDFSQMGEAAADTLISMLDSPNPQILASAMHTISQFKDLSKFKIPLQPFIENLINENENVQIAAGAYISRLLEMNTPNLKIEQYIPRFFDFSLGIQKNLLPLLGKCWKTVPEVLPLCIKVLRSDENEISEVASGVLSNLAKDSPEKIINLLLNEQETESFIRMGRISTALTKICKTIPEKGIQLMLSALTATNENVKINACSVLGALSSQYGKQIPLKPLLNIWFQDPNAKVKKEIAKAVSNIAAQQPDTIKPLMPTILKGVTDPDNSVRLTVAKLFVDLGEKSPDLIPFTAIKTMTEDKDAYIRENGLKLLAVTSKRFPKEAIQVVYQCLKDPEWNVKNAAADTFGKLSVNIDDADILNGLKQMITDKEKWVRIKGLGVIAKVIDNHPNLLSFKEITQMINTETDMDVLVNLAKIFGVIAASNFTQALPMILKLMSHPERNIREGMIAGMVGMSLKVPLSTLVPPLLKYFSDDSELVLQQSIALLLKRILRYEGEDLKLRVIPMLKIRCQVTQDPILSEVLSDLQASIKK